jgi:iron complex outermembrane recepter protein
MRVWRVCSIVLGLCALWSSQLLADSSSDATGESVTAGGKAPQPETMQEIVVTAQKREQALSDVGLTVVAATGAQLQSVGVTDVASLTKLVPSLTTTTNTNGLVMYSLRGVNYNAYQISAQPTVAVYLDEAPLPYPVLTRGSTLDVERVEVLKGPQGTLFGQNATGGSVNFIAAKPTSTFAAGSEVSVNNWMGVDAQAYVSGPITDTLRARVSASTSQFGAWQQDYADGDGQTNGRANRGAARLLLDWTPFEGLKVALNLNGNEDHSQPQAFQAAGLSPANPAGLNPGFLTYPPPPADDRAAGWDVGFQPYRDDYMGQGVLRVDYDLNEDMTLTSQTDFIHDNVNEQGDIDGTSVISTLSGPKGSVKSVSQEVRLTGKIPSEGINYIIGANYQHDDIEDGTFLETPYYSALPHDSSLFGNYAIGYLATGIFANADWEFLPRFTLTGGARYTKTHESLSGCLFDGGNGVNSAFFGGTSDFLRSLEGLPAAPPIPPGGCVTLDDRPTLPGGLSTWLPYDPRLSQDEHNVSWRGGLNFKPAPDTLLYALVSRGFKAGGFPAGLTTFASEIQPVKQEELTSYEIGTKLSLFNGALQPNISGFYYDYKNKQVLAYYKSFLGLLDTFQNLPTAKVEGVDADLTIVPFSGLTIRPAITYVHSSLGNYQTVNSLGLEQNVGGNRLSFAPEVSAVVDAEYDMQLGNYVGFIGGNAQVESGTYADLAESPRTKIPGYSLFDVRVGARSSAGWHASLWVRNLSNHYYWTNIISSGDELIKPTGLPRTFGVTVGVNFH